MGAEIGALEDNITWDLEELPPGKKTLGCKWVFRIKHKSDGTTEWHKSRLLVLGNNQIESIDCKETFAPVAKMSTVQIFLDVAAKRDFEFHQMDVHNGFLHGDLKEEVWMKLLPGFGSPNETHVCRLRKPLYGLRQAPRCWFTILTTALREYDFTQSKKEYSFFSFICPDVCLHFLVYVDDLIISGNTAAVIQKFKDYLSSCFHMKDFGILEYFLRIEVARNSTGIYLCQQKYALDILTETGILGCKSSGSPIDQNHKLALASGNDIADPKKYRRLMM